MIKKLISLFTLCFAISVLQAQIDIAKIISGTYSCRGTISRYTKENAEKYINIDNDKAIVRIEKIGENKVRISMSGAKSTIVLQLEPNGSDEIQGYYPTKDNVDSYVDLNLSYKPATIKGHTCPCGTSEERPEVWTFQGTANEAKPESIIHREEKEEIDSEKTELSDKYKDQYGRNWNGPFPFTDNSIRTNAPKEVGVYQILKKSGNDYKVMYIGIATGSDSAKGERSTINTRLRKHYIGNGNKIIARLGNPSELWFVYWLCDRASAKQIESKITTDDKPPFNLKREYVNYIQSISLH